MTVPTNKIKQSFACDGVTVAFPFTNISFYVSADLDVLISDPAAGTETVLTQNTDYTVTPTGAILPYTAGTITLIGAYAAAPPTTGKNLVVYRDAPYTQEIDLVTGGAMQAATLEEGYDRAVMLLQQLYDLLNRTVTLPISSTLPAIPLPVPDALKFIRWNAAESGLENSAILDPGLLVVTAFIETLLDDADAATARATLGLGNAATMTVDADLPTLALPASTTISAHGKDLVGLSAGAALALLRMNSGGTAPEWGSAGQIVFPATQNPSSNANTLDDYEEGTWTPALKFGGNAVGMAYGTQSGFYTKIGRLLHLFAVIVLTAKGTSTGAATITGVPFSIAASSEPVTVFVDAITFGGTLEANAAGTTVSLFDISEAGGLGYITNADFANTSALRISFVTYI